MENEVQVEMISDGLEDEGLSGYEEEEYHRGSGQVTGHLLKHETSCIQEAQELKR